MRCGYHDAGVCGSCTLIAQPYPQQVDDQLHRVRTALGDPAGVAWLPPVTSTEAGFRNKAKMVVGGTVEAPTLGILDAHGLGVDLQGCPLYPDALSAAFAPLAAFVTEARLEPYDVPEGRGELKHLIVTVSPDGELMVRFVLRSTEALARIRKHLPSLQSALPSLVVASVNVQPAHAAVLEGDEAVSVVRALNGATDGRQAAPGTIRGDLSLSNRENLVHGSDSPESAAREIELWFPGR